MIEAPLIIGAGGGKGGGGGGTEDPDSAASRSYAQVVDLVSEGEVEGLVGGMQGVILNGTKLQNPDGSFNFSGVSFAFQPGTQGQNYIAGFSDIENENGVGLEVKQQQPIIRTITTSTVNAVRVTIAIPRLTYQDPGNGDIHGTTLDLAIDVQTANGGFVQRIRDTINEKISSQYEKSYRIDLYGAGPWDVRVRRLTADSTTSNLSNTLSWASYTEITDVKLTYPNSAICALRIDAGQFQAIPTRAYHMRLLRIQVPSNYDPVNRTYSGVWDGTFKIAWSNNPAWCFCDLLTNERYGLGLYVSPSQIDKWELYSIGQYCDQYIPDGFGGYEPRFTLNCYIQNYADAYQVVQDLASAFRGMVYWGGGAVTAVQDAPADPVALFTPANVIDGQFSYMGASLKARHTVALVSWTNLADMGKTYVEYVDDPVGVARYGVIQTQVTAFGCTSRGQAHRVGKWILYSERLESETVTFKIGLDGAGVRPGDIIKVADPVRAGSRLGGRISASDGANQLTVDADLVDAQGNPLNAVGANISVIAVDGTVRTGVVLSQNGRVLNLSGSQGLLTMLGGVQPQAMWILEPATVQAQLFRVVQITESERSQFAVTALAHNPSKYNSIEYGYALDVRDITDLSTAPAAPASVSISENLYLYQSNVFSQVTISWPSVNNAISYRVGYSKDGGAWVFVTTPSNTYDIHAAPSGSYDVRVWTIGAAEVQSSGYAETVQRVYGKTLPPADVVGLTYGIDQNLGLRLAWAANTDVDLYGYEVRKATNGTDWASATPLGQIKGTSFTVGVQNCTGTYLVKAIDTQGNYSQHVASVAATVPQTPAPVLTGQFVGVNYSVSWLAVVGYLATDHYEVRTDTNFGQAGAVATIKGTAYSGKVNWAGPETFYVAAVDIGGNYSAYSSVTMVVTVPSQPQITAQVVDNNVLLKWTASVGTLPVDHYNVAKGATLATATPIGTINGTFDTIFETAPGNFTYWITPVDAAGNIGDSASATVFVNQPPDYVLRYDYTADFDGIMYNFDGGGLQGFTAAGAILTAGNGLTVASTGTNPQLIRTYTTIDNFAGCEYPRVRVGVTRMAGSGWKGEMYWQTSARASYSESYNCTIAANPAIGTKTTLEFDLRAATAGATDWMNGTITAIRLDLGASAADVFQIDYIELIPFEQTNLIEDVDGSLVMPVNLSATFQQHFQAPGWNSPADQVAAGFGPEIEPALTSATYVEYIDYGSILPASKITVTPTYTVVDGAPSLSVTVEVSSDNTNWTTYANTTAVYVSQFRYARYTITVTGSGSGRDLLRLTRVNYRYDVKLKNDAGTIQCNSTDTNGTLVTFNVDFIAVNSITLTAMTTSPVFAVYNFDGRPDPTTFTIMLFDKNGNRIAGQVSWSAKGV